MSKIAKALEKAKKLRQSRGTQGQRLDIQASVEALRLTHHRPENSRIKAIRLNNIHLEKHRIFTFLDHALATDRYNLLCTEILQKTRAKGHNTIMVTSCVEGEGKTVTAINLATSIARKPQHTALLVDADLRNPKVQQYLGFHTQKGLSHYLEKDAAIPGLLINPGLPRMSVIAAGQTHLRSTEILSSPKMEKLVQEMKSRYPDRYVIFDCPPILSVADSLVFTTYVDGIILVVEANKTQAKQIKQAVELLKEGLLLGLVMNKSRASFKGYYY